MRLGQDAEGRMFRDVDAPAVEAEPSPEGLEERGDPFEGCTGLRGVFVLMVPWLRFNCGASDEGHPFVPEAAREASEPTVEVPALEDHAAECALHFISLLSGAA